ncbi:hypothetical protein HBZC1_08010 [Helicobacter bizzozeronii CIII-1]|uniref:Uncharacterized protein n=1 Tax=Helicobacter bizzozeronii (strain CIII-1) TaxID=1002804 RepID=F8KSL6_HELBC|nr:hypothetical protein HBZC1_08010 [Helicobacter bizzozeronii CIII-1]
MVVFGVAIEVFGFVVKGKKGGVENGGNLFTKLSQRNNKNMTLLIRPINAHSS